MASSVHSKTIAVNEATLWGFLREKGNWAALIPGYIQHELISENEMTWEFKGDFGYIQKDIKLQLNVKEVVENEKITFELVGLSDNINGSGYFEMKKIEDEEFLLTGNLGMKAGGFMAAMVNPVLEKFLPSTVEELVNAMAENAVGTIA